MNDNGRISVVDKGRGWGVWVLQIFFFVNGFTVRWGGGNWSGGDEADSKRPRRYPQPAGKVDFRGRGGGLSSSL